MPILGTVASQFSGKSFNSYESIATATVGSGGESYIEFTFIPSTYEHLHIRYTSLNSTTTSSLMQINGDTGSNYAYHYLGRAGAGSVVASGSGSQSTIFIGNTQQSTIPLSHIIDILDYKNTSKYKTIKLLSGGYQGAYAPWVGMNSGLWQNTNSITSLKFYPGSGNLLQYSKATLYGIKGV
jgi:hypothetical protein